MRQVILIHAHKDLHQLHVLVARLLDEVEPAADAVLPRFPREECAP